MLKVSKSIFLQTIRTYHRPPNRPKLEKMFSVTDKVIPSFIQKSIEKNWYPVTRDGQIKYLNVFKIGLLMTLIPLTLYEMHRNEQRIEAGEKTSADAHYDNYGIDLGFRSVSRGRLPACAHTDTCLIKADNPLFGFDFQVSKSK